MVQLQQYWLRRELAALLLKRARRYVDGSISRGKYKPDAPASG